MHCSRRRLRALSLLAFTLPLAACGNPSATPTPGPTAIPGSTSSPASPSSDGPELLLEVTGEGGFVNPTAHIGELPEVVVDTDGRIYMPDQSAAEALIPSVVVRDVGATGESAIAAGAAAAGLDVESADTCGVVGDSRVLVFTYVLDGQEVVNRFGTGSGPVGPGLPGGGAPSPLDCSVRQTSALEFLAELLDPTQTWGQPAAPENTYDPVAYRLWVAPVAGDAATASAWPLGTAPDVFGMPAQPIYGVGDLRVGVVLGADAQHLQQALAKASAGSTFAANDRVYQLWVRPLLPDELG